MPPPPKRVGPRVGLISGAFSSPTPARGRGGGASWGVPDWDCTPPPTTLWDAVQCVCGAPHRHIWRRSALHRPWPRPLPLGTAPASAPRPRPPLHPPTNGGHSGGGLRAGDGGGSPSASGCGTKGAQHRPPPPPRGHIAGADLRTDNARRGGSGAEAQPPETDDGWGQGERHTAVGTPPGHSGTIIALQKSGGGGGWLRDLCTSDPRYCGTQCPVPRPQRGTGHRRPPPPPRGQGPPRHTPKRGRTSVCPTAAPSDAGGDGAPPPTRCCAPRRW